MLVVYQLKTSGTLYIATGITFRSHHTYFYLNKIMFHKTQFNSLPEFVVMI